MTEPVSPADRSKAARKARFGLSGKLLVLTVLSVMLAEVLIYVPSVANFRVNWLRDRLAAAHVAAMVMEAAPADMMCRTSTPRATSASARSRRWHRHHIASAHITTVGASDAQLVKVTTASSNSGVSM